VRFENEVPMTVDYGRGDMVGLKEVLLKSARRPELKKTNNEKGMFDV